MNENKIILDLCGGTGSWSRFYTEAGYDVRLVTLPENDVREYVPPDEVYGILAAPPCTMFSRARTTAKTPRDFEGAMEVVYACLKIIWEHEYRNPFKLKFWALENPKGHLQRFLGKPVFSFQPYEFGDRYSKETYLWGNFNLPVKQPVLIGEELRWSKNNTRPLPKIEGMKLNVAARRSITPPNFARAFFEANL